MADNAHYDVCVMGLGYIGLPTAAMLAASGARVLGIDTNPAVIETVGRGEIHIEEPGLKTIVRAAIGSGHLSTATAAAPADVFIIAVPTPITADKHADMAFVVGAAEAVVPHLRSGNLVILESTSPPGTCAELVRPILEKSGLKVGTDLYLAHCPERVLPGRILTELIANDRVIGGHDRASAERAREVYARFVEGEIFLTDATTAEMVKIIENTYRDVNIALANETARLCENLGIDFWEVARFANRHPRVQLHHAGPGVGGHCISVDPWFLVERFPEDTPLIALARARNDAMPAHVVARILALISGCPKPVVAALGLAYKGNVDDLRESPALEVVRLLREKGCDVRVHDPLVKRAPFETLPLEECLKDADCAVILTGHDVYGELDPAWAGTLMRRKYLYDTCHLVNRDAWRAAGFNLLLLGCGRPSV